MNVSYVEQSIQLIADVPARSRAERDAWVCRNLTEFALALEVVGGCVEALDQAVSKADLDRTNTPRRFVDRLRGMRERRGTVPSHYPTGNGEGRNPERVSQKVEVDAFILSQFADILRSPSKPTGAVSALLGAGERAFRERLAWRPTSNDTRVRFVEIPDLPTSLLWRGWFLVPTGPTMVVVDERLDPVRMDIWWGVHNGTHLDHLAAATETGPSLLEFGEGLLVSESLAMSAELLAGAEALASGLPEIQQTIAEGLEERIGRLCLIDYERDSETFQRAVASWSDEFADLPVLSEAYVSGPLDLLRRRHSHELIPSWISENFEKRWTEVASAHEGVFEFIRRVRS